MIELTDEYREAAKEFKKTFGYGVPLSMIPPTVTTNELISRIKECISTKKDDLLSDYQLDNEDGVLY